MIRLRVLLFVSILCILNAFHGSPRCASRIGVMSGNGRKRISKFSSGCIEMINPSLAATIGSATAVAGVIAFHEAGHFLAAKWQGMKVTSYNIGYGPKVIAFNDSSSTEFALRLIPLGGYVAFPANIEVDEEGNITKELDDPDLLQNRPPLQRALVISAGVMANILLSFMLATGTAMTTGLAHPTFSPGILVTAMPDPNSPAVMAGLRANDVIMRLDGRELSGSLTLMDDFIGTVRSHPEDPLTIEYLRDGSGELVKTVITPNRAGNGKGTIGIAISNRIAAVDQVVAKDLLEGMREGARETGVLVSTTWNSFLRTVTSGMGSEVGGPLSVVQAGAQLAAYSPAALIGFAATLSVNLAVLNSLPFPALDGGQLAFVLVELLAGRPLPRRFQDSLTALAFAVLLGLGVSTIVGDVGKLGSSQAIPPFASSVTAPAPASPARPQQVK